MSLIATRSNLYISRFSSCTCTGSMKHRILITGGGTGGISLAARLRNMNGVGDVAIVEPEMHHYYQPLFTLVGAGEMRVVECRKSTKDLIPSGQKWYKTRVARFSCAENMVELENGSKVKYDILVVALGIRNDWDKIKGLKNAVGHDFVVTNYGVDQCEKTWKYIQMFKKGTAIFTMPAGVIKCPGAPQKIMYLAEDYWRRKGCRNDTKIKWMSGIKAQFGIRIYSDALTRICDQRGIERNYMKNLVEIRTKEKEAIFEVLRDNNSATPCLETEKFDFLHVSPSQCPPSVLTTSDLCQNGFMDVNRNTLQSKVYTNVFGLGDCTNVPTSRTGAAVACEAKAVAANVKAFLTQSNKSFPGSYDGYASCPLVCGKSQCILAEFNAFNGSPLETFPFDQSVPRTSMFLLKRYGLPMVYWNLMMKGLWSGPRPFRKLFTPLRRILTKS